MRSGTVFLGALVLSGVTASAQQPAAPKPVAPAAAAASTTPIERRDAALEAANDLVGRALILRCFCAENNLAFDDAGHAQQAVKLTDWTLAGVNVQKAERRDGGVIELDGVRVAVRFAPDRREFDRHPQNDEKVKILVADSGAPGAFAHALDAVFAEGLDLRLQKAMPAYWLHYFVPSTPWPKDGLEAAAIVSPGTPGAPAGITDARPTQRHDAGYSPEGSHDRVAGVVLLRAVVDTQGTPRRTTIVQPLGYGLDARAVEALDKFRFAPAMTQAGRPVASNVLVRQEFAVVPGP
jgi:TonB family protein